MGFLIAILTLVLIGLVVLVVSAPLRRARGVSEQGADSSLASQVGDGEAGGVGAPTAYPQMELEAAREAKYHEIRDAELDYRTGKLSRADYEAIDADLRAEAIDILNRLEPSGPLNRLEPSGPLNRLEPSAPGSLEQQEGVQEEQHGEKDGPAI
jgi:hypothetical protein